MTNNTLTPEEEKEFDEVVTLEWLSPFGDKSINVDHKKEALQTIKLLVAFIEKVEAEAKEEARKEVVEKIKEFRHEYRNVPVSSEFDLGFDSFLLSLKEPSEEE